MVAPGGEGLEVAEAQEHGQAVKLVRGMTAGQAEKPGCAVLGRNIMTLSSLLIFPFLFFPFLFFFLLKTGFLCVTLDWN